jgi:hypothetical protein
MIGGACCPFGGRSLPGARITLVPTLLPAAHV